MPDEKRESGDEALLARSASLKRGPGRPKKIQPELISDLVDSPAQFEATMRDFFREGRTARLQRWLQSAGGQVKAYKIADQMMSRFYDKLVEIMPDFGEEK